MKTTLAKTSVVVAALALAASAFAQSHGQGPGHGNGSGNGGGTSQIDVLHPVTVEGTVVRFTAEPGLGMPTLVVRDATAKETAFVLGPYRYISAQGFSAQPGDAVRVTTYPCSSCPGGAVVAQVVNVTRNLTLKLRAADGAPLFGGGNRGRGRNAGNGQGRCDGSGPDVARATNLEGTVRSFTGGPGVGQPTLVLTTPAGDRTVLLSPYRALVTSGFTPAEGMRLVVTAAPVVRDGTEEWVALSVKDLATGLTLALRDPATGLPVGGRGRGCGRS